MSLNPSQLGNLCLALRTSSSISFVQLVLPEGDALVVVLTFLEEAGESCERPTLLLSCTCLGAVVGLALREDTLELRPLVLCCCCCCEPAARVTRCRAEDDEFWEHMSRFPGLDDEKRFSAAFGLEDEVTMAGLLPLGHEVCLIP